MESGYLFPGHGQKLFIGLRAGEVVAVVGNGFQANTQHHCKHLCPGESTVKEILNLTLFQPALVLHYILRKTAQDL